MRNVDIEVFPIAKTQVDRVAVRRWLDYLHANNYEIPDDEAVTDPALLIALAAKRCYLSFEPGLNPNVTKVRQDLADYLDNILKSGHGSVLEHSVYTFAIEGVSRVFTGEMNRHRAGVGISEGSMRYIRLTDIPWWVPTCLRLTLEEQAAMDKQTQVWSTVCQNLGKSIAFSDPQVLANLDAETVAINKMALKKVASTTVFNQHFTMTERNYAKLAKIWEEELAPKSSFKGKKQVTSMMRRIAPMGTATGGVWTMNIRAVRHIITMRASEAAEEEIAYVFGRIAKIMTEAEPMLMGDFEKTPEGFWKPKYVKI
jgi:thymidylate synthase (FAD)